MSGFFIGPSLRYQKNKTSYIKGGLDEKEYLKKFSIGLVIGGQSYNQPISVDDGIGMGYKNLSFRKYLEYVEGLEYQDMPSGLYDFSSKGFNFEIFLTIGGFFDFKK